MIEELRIKQGLKNTINSAGIRPYKIDEDNYTCLRLSFGINPHIVTPKYKSYFKGEMIYITIGMGGSVER